MAMAPDLETGLKLTVKSDVKELYLVALAVGGAGLSGVRGQWEFATSLGTSRVVKALEANIMGVMDEVYL
jgi:hypothetical protein